MKVVVKTLTGERFELVVNPEDTVKDLKAQLFRTGKVTKVVRLLQGQTELQDDLKISEFNIQDGDTISALFEPDVDIDLEIEEVQQKSLIVVPISTSVMALKLMVNDILKCGVPAEKMEMTFGDVTLQDDLPLHHFGVSNGSTLSLLKPYVNVIVENNHGFSLYQRIDRSKTIEEVKEKLASLIAPSWVKPKVWENPWDTDEDEESEAVASYNGRNFSVENMRLYFVTKDKEYKELYDHEKVKGCKIMERDRLYLLSYRWTNNDVNVTESESNLKIEGVEAEDTILSVKVRVQDQMGIPVKEMNVSFANEEYHCDHYDAEPLPSDEKKISSLDLSFPVNLIVKSSNNRAEAKGRDKKSEEESWNDDPFYSWGGNPYHKKKTTRGNPRKGPQNYFYDGGW